MELDIVQNITMGNWAKVQRGRKPIGWWIHKILCEIGWAIRNYDNWVMYYKHLNILCKKYHFNLYGQNISKMFL